MSNLGKTNRCVFLFLAVLASTALICQPSPLCAGNAYQLKAKGKTAGPYLGAPDFSLMYNDADGDKLFSRDELIPGTFTGVTLGGYAFYGISGVPIKSLSSPLTDGPPYGSVPEAWAFKNNVNGTTWNSVFWTYSQSKIEQWKFIVDGGKGSGKITLIEKEGGSVTADVDWRYTYLGENVTGAYSDAAVKIAGSSISVSGSGTATNSSAPPGYQTSPFTAVYSGKALNGEGSGTVITTFTTSGWPANISGSWEATRTSGSGLTAELFSKYFFTYSYNNGLGDSYKGYFFAPTGYNGYKVGYTKDVIDENKQTGKYTITGALDIGPDNSKNGQVFVTEYSDRDQSKKSFTPLNSTSPMGKNFLGSELGYIKNAGVGVYEFGQGFYEADAGDTYAYRYAYTNGDYYEGKFYRDPLSATYYPGQKISKVNELKLTGYYQIMGVSQSNVDSSKYGQVFVSSYYDGDTSGKSVPVVNPTALKGTGSLGSELGYIKNSGVSVYLFGKGYYEADARDTYTFRYTYGNGDYYEGKFYRDPLSATYYPGQKISKVNELGKTGYYEIKGVSHSKVASTSYGQVFVTQYFDGDKTGQSVPVVNPTAYKGTGSLGSELGYIKNSGVSEYKFGKGYYEADAGDTYTYRYTYGNGDYYEGKFYRAPLSATYYPGQKISKVNELGKTGYYEIKGVSHSKVDKSKYGQVFVTQYFDGDKTGQSVPVVNPTASKGTGSLGSELGYIKNSGVSVYKFGKGYYEADAGDTYTYCYTYGNGDYYEGYLYRGPLSTVYYPGQKINVVNELGKTGYYEIKGVGHSGMDSSKYGQVFVTKYYDGDKTGQSVPVVNPTAYQGTTFLGSELGYIKNAGVSVYKFGMGYYEADAGNTYTYRYTYTNGDYYEGYVYRNPLDTVYYPGQKINVVNELKLAGYYEIKGVSYTNLESDIFYGKVYVTRYYDGDKTTPKPYTGTQLLPANTYFGAGYLKSEYGYIGSRTTSVSPNYFGGGFYEADL